MANIVIIIILVIIVCSICSMMLTSIYSPTYSTVSLITLKNEIDKMKSKLDALDPQVTQVEGHVTTPMDPLTQNQKDTIMSGTIDYIKYNAPINIKDGQSLTINNTPTDIFLSTSGIVNQPCSIPTKSTKNYYAMAAPLDSKQIYGITFQPYPKIS